MDLVIDEQNCPVSKQFESFLCSGFQAHHLILVYKFDSESIIV